MSHSEKKWVYVAAPYTNPDPVENSHVALKVADALEALGVVPIIPHLTLMWHLVTPRQAQFWYDYTMELMKRCDAVYRVPGKSKGADLEEKEARRIGIPVLLNWHELKAWLSKEVYNAWKDSACGLQTHQW